MTERMRRRRPTSNDTGFSDEFLCGLTRGLYVPASRETRTRRRETYNEGDTFEQTYPRYPFSELVRMSLKLAKWITRRRAAADQQDRQKRLSAPADPKHVQSKFVSPNEG